jgi:hypothetical protein
MLLFDALNCANWIRGVQICEIAAASANEDIQDALFLLERPKPGAPPSA